MILNPDKEEREIKAQEIHENDGFCPCMIERSIDTKCPCKDKREKEICICGFYVKVPPKCVGCDNYGAIEICKELCSED